MMFKSKLNLRVLMHNLFRIPKVRCNSSGVSGGETGKSSGVSGNTNDSGPTMYECRKYGHTMPCDSVTPNFETLPNIPTGVFRCTAGEILGRGANKCGLYQNPEYFSFHHMTFYDMHMLLRPYRQCSAKTGRKK